MLVESSQTCFADAGVFSISILRIQSSIEVDCNFIISFGAPKTLERGSFAQKRLLGLLPDLLLIGPFDEAGLDIHQVEGKFEIDILDPAG